VIVKVTRKVLTRDKRGDSNGWLLPIFNVHDGIVKEQQHPKQVYLTAVAPRSVKGPHLHLKRWGLFTCIRGDVVIVVRTEKGYEEFESGEAHEFATIQVPAGTPAALFNPYDVEAWVLNMPSPSWHPDDQDDHPVRFDDYDFSSWTTRRPIDAP
jgi:dTDP-4-dehydrorhamnose 3,5-epimerase-like enzyme